MNLIFDRAFDEDIERIKDRKLKQRIEVALLELQSADSLYSYSGDVKSLSRTSNYYRIRIGDYRLILKEVDKGIKLLHFRHRKEIYKVIT